MLKLICTRYKCACMVHYCIHVYVCLVCVVGRPFDPALYEDEVEDEGEFLDEDGRARLKLKVENTIRWRKKVNDNGEEERESNARIVQWTDGR